MLLSRNLLSRFAIVLCIFESVARAWQTECSDFSLQGLSDVVVRNTTYYAAGDTVNITTNLSTIDTNELPAFCRVQLTITTNSTANSSCDTEVWLPDDWNGRFLTVGNGGYAGSVIVGDLAYIAVLQGFAGVSTDTGHVSSEEDGSWAGPGNNNSIVDWAWRALHLSVVTGKEVVKQYYGTAQNASYYIGCSDGGRQGLKEVQVFSDDFDGVVVGSPAWYITNLQAWGTHMSLNVLPEDSDRFINESVWIDVIHPEVLAQCDAQDGLADGIIGDPRYCLFRPETLTCRPEQNASTCLTPIQLEALRRMYTDYYEADQTWEFGRYFPGGETAYPEGYANSEPFEIDVDWFRYFVLNDTEWSIYEYNASVLALANEIDPGQAKAVSPNLTAFVGPEHNGKLLHYVGWADQLISPAASIHYYERVYSFMTANTEMEIDDFYRLFTVPGMNHCGGGYGPNAFGAAGQAASGAPPYSFEPEYNILAAMVQWVENGIAPSNLTGVYWNNNDYTDGLGFARPLCQFPASIHYIGGNVTSAESFTCI